MANSTPQLRSLIQAMMNMGITLPSGLSDEAKNVAMVYVTAIVPPQGARRGDEFDCTISAVTAKSLEGGMLLPTPLLDKPAMRPEDSLVYALASGAIVVEEPALPTRGKVSGGCRMEQNFLNPFVENNRITLVLKPSHARFRVVDEVAFQINSYPVFREESDDSQQEMAQPIDQMSIEVLIPEQYQHRPVAFAALLMEVPLTGVPGVETVVVNETTGVIAMSADLEISPYALQHKNMAIEIGDGTVGDQLVAVDPDSITTMPTLQALVQSLNALRVSAQDMIAVIRALDRAGAIHGRVIYEQ